MLWRIPIALNRYNSTIEVNYTKRLFLLNGIIMLKLLPRHLGKKTLPVNTLMEIILLDGARMFHLHLTLTG